MGAHHQHHHTFEEGRFKDRRRLLGILALTASYMVAELIGGYVSRSLSLMADAAHMFSDVAALSLSIFAIWLAQKPASSIRTYGYHRTEILAALANGLVLLLVAFGVLREAYDRFQSPEAVASGMMMVVAFGGLVVNLIGLLALSKRKKESINMRGAWLHVLMDALGSVGVLISGAVIWFTGWVYADPLASVIIACMVIFSAFQLLRETVFVLMESVPAHLDLDAVRDAMIRVEGVKGVHDLHIWTITSGVDSLSAHVVVGEMAHSDTVLKALHYVLSEQFLIHHVTVQIETEHFSTLPACKS